MEISDIQLVDGMIEITFMNEMCEDIATIRIKIEDAIKIGAFALKIQK